MIKNVDNIKELHIGDKNIKYNNISYTQMKNKEKNEVINKVVDKLEVDQILINKGLHSTL